MARLVTLTLVLFSFDLFALKDFQSDYCTMTPNGNWKECCYEHDLFYWLGGTKDHQKILDLDFRNCIKNKAGSLIASIYYYGVRIGHYSPIKHKTRWSWGWEKKRRNIAFSKEELQEIRLQLQRQGFQEEYINSLIKKLPQRS